MPEVRKYNLKPTALVPNSPQPLLHYPGILSAPSACTATSVYDLFSSNEWEVQWVYRYGSTQTSHYHSGVHECMAVLSGNAMVRFGVADDDVPEVKERESASLEQEMGVELQARAGDVFVIPAGVAHKTFNASPPGERKLLTPGDGHHIAATNARHALSNIELSGFTMIGAYPKGGGPWDFSEGGEHAGQFEKVWSVSKPQNDPVLGNAKEGLCGQWQEVEY
jgi:uncharacterized protein YjlB